MVVAKITPPAVKLPTAPLPKPVITAEQKLPAAPGNDGAKYKPELDNSAILENRKGNHHKVTGQLDLPGHLHPIPIKPPVGDTLIQDAQTVLKNDSNGDGKLNADEFDKTQSPFLLKDENKFDRYDSDNDGYVTGEEYHAGAESDRNRIHFEPHPFPSNPGPFPHLGDVAINVAKGVAEAPKDAASKVADAVKDLF